MLPAEAEGTYTIDGVTLHKSGFNPDWMGEFGIDPKTVIVVGSYDLGDEVRFKKKWPKAKVWGYEACPHRAKIIKENILPKFSGIYFDNCAISDSSGEVDFYPAKINGQYDGQGSLGVHTGSYKDNYKQVDQQAPVKVQCRKLGNLLGFHPDLVHIDVEGFEIYVLRGLEDLRPEVIFLEYIVGGKGWVGCTKEDEIEQWAKDNKYEVVLYTGIDYLLRKKGK